MHEILAFARLDVQPRLENRLARIASLPAKRRVELVEIRKRRETAAHRMRGRRRRDLRHFRRAIEHAVARAAEPALQIESADRSLGTVEA